MLGHDAGGTRELDNAESEKTLASLSFRGPTLHWTHNGQPRESTLGTR